MFTTMYNWLLVILVFFSSINDVISTAGTCSSKSLSTSCSDTSKCVVACCDGFCPSSACDSSLDSPDGGAQCNNAHGIDCRGETECFPVNPSCGGPGTHCLGTIHCTQPNCGGHSAGDQCLYDGNSENYKICTRKSSFSGDPQFAGFQGQQFQMHGYADEYFNLISTPKLQLNSHFVYMSSGSCTFNDTDCFSHPGTYIDKLGFYVGTTKIKVIAGSHDSGMHVWIDDKQMNVNDRTTFDNSDDMLGDKQIIHFKSKNVVEISTTDFIFIIENADYFFNMNFVLKDRHILKLGKKKVVINDKVSCDYDSQHNKHSGRQKGEIQKRLLQYYPSIPISGIVGSTWMNIEVCNKKWIGIVDDYVVTDLFESDYVYCNFDY
jgi:hypothetical protein